MRFVGFWVVGRIQGFKISRTTWEFPRGSRTAQSPTCRCPPAPNRCLEKEIRFKPNYAVCGLRIVRVHRFEIPRKYVGIDTWVAHCRLSCDEQMLACPGLMPGGRDVGPFKP